MTIEQHAEAAVREYWDAANRADGTGKAMTHYIASHMTAAIDEATAPLRARISKLERSLRQQNYEVCQTLGKALRYPWFKDDQVNFPGASRLDGVCTADHTPETLAVEAAKRIAKLEGLGPLIEEVKRRAYSTGTQRAIGDNEWPLSREKMREAEAQIDAILKGENAACDAVEGE